MQDHQSLESSRSTRRLYVRKATLVVTVLLCFFWLFWLMSTQSPQNRWLDSLLFKDRSQSMLPYITYFVTWDETLRIQDVTDNDTLPFASLKDEELLSFGSPDEHVWIRFMPSQFTADMQADDYVVYFDDTFFLDWDYYRPYAANGSIQYQKAIRDMSHPKHAIFPYEIIKQEDVKDHYYYIHYQKENMAHHFLLNTHNHFHDTQIRLLSIMLASIGFLLGMIAMNFLMLYSTKERQYLFHILFQGCSLLLLVLLSGLTLWISGHVYGIQVLQLQVVTVLAAGLFFYHFQDLGHRYPRVSALFRILLIIGAVSTAIAFVLPYDQLLLFAQVITGALLLVEGVVAITLFISGYRVTFRFLIGFLLTISAGFMSSLSVLGVIPISLTAFYFIYPAFAVESLLFSSSITSEIRKRDILNRTLHVEANTDALTGLRNRHYIENIIKPELLALERQQQPISMLMFDIDLFKDVNDKYGHDVGDRVLVTLSQMARDFFRSTDSITRWGGEEFAIFMPSTTLKQARDAGERFRRHVETWVFPPISTLTISLGAAQKTWDESYEQWFKRADSAMYLSKKFGRNRIEISYALLDAAYKPIEVLWQTSLESGHPVIDADHIRLIKHVNRLLHQCFDQREAPLPLAEINALLSLTVEHFSQEELILSEIRYPYLDEHALEHKRLLEKAQMMLDAVLNGTCELALLLQFVVGELIVGHMKQEDMLFFRYLPEGKQPR